MKVLETEQEWSRRQRLQAYLRATPVGRFWINHWRRQRGEAPLRLKEVRTELAARWRRLDAAR